MGIVVPFRRPQSKQAEHIADQSNKLAQRVASAMRLQPTAIGAWRGTCPICDAPGSLYAVEAASGLEGDCTACGDTAGIAIITRFYARTATGRCA
jgi:hypothetical protein